MWAGSGAGTGIRVSFILLELLDPPESLCHGDNPYQEEKEGGWKGFQSGQSVVEVKSPSSHHRGSPGVIHGQVRGETEVQNQRSSPLSSLSPPQEGKIPSKTRTSENLVFWCAGDEG